MRILLVKLSSMGDVIHNLPVVSDIRRARPEAQIDWVVEPPFAPIVRLHPEVKRVFPMPLREVKKRWWSMSAWRALRQARGDLARARYDLILDTQGLMKSAWVANGCHAPVAGFDAASAREPGAVRRYQYRYAVDREQHAVARNRQLAAAALDYPCAPRIDYGIAAPAGNCPEDPYVVLLHATSRADKGWPRADWVALGRRLNDHGLLAVLPWGSAPERFIARQIAGQLGNARVPDAMRLDDVATLLGGARAVVGVDTGLSHLAVALGRPTVGIYVTTDPARTGLCGSTSAVNLGGGSRQHPGAPDVESVWAALQPALGT